MLRANEVYIVHFQAKFHSYGNSLRFFRFSVSHIENVSIKLVHIKYHFDTIFQCWPILSIIYSFSDLDEKFLLFHLNHSSKDEILSYLKNFDFR